MTSARIALGVVVFAVASVVVPLQRGPRSIEELDRDAVAAVATSSSPASVSTEPTVGSVEDAVRPAPTGVARTAAAVSPPVRVALPSIGVTSDLEQLPLLADGTISPPVDFAQAGWFAAGPAPGQPGPAVIAGHVDSYSGPAVFFRLNELQPGDPIDVTRGDGSTVSFRVTSVEEHAKDEFPTAAVYGPVAGSELRVITCGGQFDHHTGHYLANVVVFAVATATE